jgi:hypothetical protein
MSVVVLLDCYSRLLARRFPTQLAATPLLASPDSLHRLAVAFQASHPRLGRDKNTRNIQLDSQLSIPPLPQTRMTGGPARAVKPAVPFGMSFAVGPKRQWISPRSIVCAYSPRKSASDSRPLNLERQSAAPFLVLLFRMRRCGGSRAWNPVRNGYPLPSWEPSLNCASASSPNIDRPCDRNGI